MNILGIFKRGTAKTQPQEQSLSLSDAGMDRDILRDKLQQMLMRAKYEEELRQEEIQQIEQQELENRMLEWMLDNPDVMRQFEIDDAERILRS